MLRIAAVLIGVAVALPAAPVRPDLSVASPDGNVRVMLTAPRLAWSVAYRGRAVLNRSSLGLTFEGSGPWGASVRVANVARNRHTGSWHPIYGERSTIPENYTELLVDLEDAATPRRKIQVAVRAYNEGAAIRYHIPAQAAFSQFAIASEDTEFAVPPGTRAWETHGAQQQYENVWTTDLKPGTERPLTIEYPNGTFAALVEAGVRDYPRGLFSPVASKPGTLITHLSDTRVTGTAPFSTAWRAIILGDRAGDLLERNYLLLNLNQPAVYADTSWIKPGKVLREVTLSTRGGKEAVDFANARNLQYIEYDAGWYGHEYDDKSDATGVNVDPLRLQKDPAYQGLDLSEVIRYARENGIGVLLYVNRRALEKQLATILPLYEQWGVKGVKYGFVNVGSQYWTKWLYDAVELAGKHRLMVDIHDEHRPTGLSRTYPNLLTQEGILGNEGMPPPQHNTVLPFTRFVAGAADYTVCYYNERIKATRAHQLALAVAFYSPFQFMYWYDRPSMYLGEPEIEFFDRVPTVWDDTKVIDGRIGQFAAIARRSGSEWFVGTINNGVPRTVRVPLSFLPEGARFRAHVYENGRGGPKDVQISVREVDSTSVIDARMPDGGGQAIWLEPAAATRQDRR